MICICEDDAKAVGYSKTCQELSTTENLTYLVASLPYVVLKMAMILKAILILSPILWISKAQVFVYAPQSCQAYMNNDKLDVWMYAEPGSVNISYNIFYTSQTNGKTSVRIDPPYLAYDSTYNGFTQEFIIQLNDILDISSGVHVQGYYDRSANGGCYNDDWGTCPYSHENETCLVPTPKPTAAPVAPNTASPTL